MKRSLTLLLALIAGTSLSALKIETFVSGLTLPVALAEDPTNSSAKFIVQQRGRIKVVLNGVLQGTDFLNLVGTVNSTGSERGLLGLAFHPNYAVNGYFYVNYTAAASSGATKIVRYTRSANPLIANAASAYPILTIAQPYQNHNGGTMRFGPDGYLYVGMGDGGDANDPGNRAQTLTTLLGKFLRINIDSDGFPTDAAKNYAIPPTNPFVGITGEDEIWSVGQRNPWKFHFDAPNLLGSGGMIIGDVGQYLYEEVNYEPPLAGGRNYGWRQWEGFHSTGLSGAGTIPRKDPIWEYSHGGLDSAVTCGPIYRGTQLTGHFGRCFVADYVRGKVWSIGITYQANGEANLVSDIQDVTTDLGLPANSFVTSIDMDSSGELYIVDLNGSVYRVKPENLIWMTDLAPLIYSSYTGALRHTLANDGKFLTMIPQTVYDLQEENQSQMQFGFTTDNLTNTTMRYSISALCNAPGNGKLEVFVKNWSTGKFVSQGLYTTTNSLLTFTKTSIASATYRRGDGRIEMLVKTYYQGIPPADPYQAFLYQVRLDPF